MFEEGEGDDRRLLCRFLSVPERVSSKNHAFLKFLKKSKGLVAQFEKTSSILKKMKKLKKLETMVRDWGQGWHGF